MTKPSLLLCTLCFGPAFKPALLSATLMTLYTVVESACLSNSVLFMNKHRKTAVSALRYCLLVAAAFLA